MMVKMLFASTAALLLDAGSAPKPGILATLKREACFGWCPVYSLEIRTDGSVTYNGEAFVVRRGTATGQLDSLGLRLLREAFERANFRELSDDCCSCYEMTDMPTVTTTLVDGLQAKTIVDYHGCMRAPESLRDLEDEIDRIVGIEQWIGTDEQRLALLRLHE